jgi:hypothetical protein
MFDFDGGVSRGTAFMARFAGLACVIGFGCVSGAGADAGDRAPSAAESSALTSSAALSQDTRGDSATTWGGVRFPWRVFDGKVPNVAPAAAPHRTYYCDPVRGNDAWDGTRFSFASGTKGPKKTISAALAIAGLAGGDTILLGGGIYRERPAFVVSGADGSPITLGSYGRGTGAPIIDGGLAPNRWVRYAANGRRTVWQTSTAGLPKLDATHPVLSVYVNGPRGESALREVAHGQLEECGTMPPRETQEEITDGSNKWYQDEAAQTLYADFGGSLGLGDPNEADISILYRSHHIPPGTEQLFDLRQNNYRFVGLTLRAASWDGCFTESTGISFEQCDIKFNGGAGVAGRSDTALLYNRFWMNVLDNWPRFNNGNTQGGWPSAIGFFAAHRSRAVGNVIYQNGGEGLIFYGTETGAVGFDNLEKNNVIFDNYSVNLYIDNTQGVRAEQNFVFAHPFDPSQTFDDLLETSACYRDNYGRRLLPINVSLADEPFSSDDYGAYLSDITLINNVVVGGNQALVDYDDGTFGIGHGLKSCLIANNTFVVGTSEYPGRESVGWQNGSLPGADHDSFFQNNIVVTQRSTHLFDQTYVAGPRPGIDVDYNLYSGPGAWWTAGTTQSLLDWKADHGWDRHSARAAGVLCDEDEFNRTAAQKPVYDWSKATPSRGAPVRRAGVRQDAFDTDFTGARRRPGAYDLGAISGH